MSRAQQSHNSHASASSYQSKPSLLAGVQDAYWSDDEEENSTCPLCIKELDLEEQSFKPCPCGYQICLFCWHHIRDNMNARCPACRREYTEEAVVWKPVAAEDSKRVQQQKRRKEKERKDLETLGRKSYLDVRIVQRNVVYVVGLGPRYAKEETISVLRSSDYFGRYGKISRVQLQKRTPPGAETPVVGLYITYVRREDAERALQAIDGSPSPSGGGEVMRASPGTAKYCTSFLRNVSCTNNNCLDAHEWGEPDDCFTREELATLKHTIKDTEKPKVSSKKVPSADAPTLPRTASWATRTVSTPSTTSQTIQLGAPGPVLRAPRQPRQPRNSSGKQAANDARDKDKRRVIVTVPASAPRHRSPTPPPASKPPGLSTPATISQNPAPPEPVPSTAPSSPQLTSSVAPSEPASVVTSPQLPTAHVSAPPGLTAPPGLAIPTGKVAIPLENVVSPSSPAAPVPLHAPPGLIRLPPGLNIAPDQSSPAPARTYHLSKHAQALIDDVRTRREAVMATATPPPIFPDFDRTLANLVNSAGFSFSFANVVLPSPDPGLPALRPARKTAFDPFASPLDRASTSAGSSPALRNIGIERAGGFSPFTDDGSEGGRSRFDFARRQTSLGPRDTQSFGQPSRGTTPFRPDTASGNTLYNSSDTGFISRQQGSWNSYQSNGSSVNNDYRYQSSASGSYQSPLALGPEHPVYGELPPTPFDQMPIADNMREMVRGFETPGIETATSRQLDLGQQQNYLGLPHARNAPHYATGASAQGQAFPYQMQPPSNQPPGLQQRMMREDAASQRMNMRSPADGTVYSSYQHQQPSGSGLASHQQNATLNSTSKDLTSPNGELHRILTRGRVY
ncbi:hypothetical protein M408DRAFT_329269 [Serendipita vermifera MAFF 305830]|uniref:RING-type domain-containing protein n=1 Tax=Serendipita vermifera MAFF 305830 TaxID=933852 RepID=A0A0C3B9N5_SERVB|nr:hypothetical protein M408DRAFT_329269 [Serendipita vermifera MAFF 305830]